MKIGIIGLGFVGSAMHESFKNKINEMKISNNYKLSCYDKYKNGGIGSIYDCIDSDIIFLALPTKYDTTKQEYDKSSIEEVVELLKLNKYNNLIVVKSTVEPLYTQQLANKYNMNFANNPEFLTAKTAYVDFHNQMHIVLGKTEQCNDAMFDKLIDVYKTLYPIANISTCTSTESECVKLFCNTFYSVKIQYFNELYLLAKKLNINYDNVLNMMLKNGWINEMHTKVPGTDGQLSYGGLCFPKDTNALLSFMKLTDTPHDVLEATVIERNKIRNDE